VPLSLLASVSWRNPERCARAREMSAENDHYSHYKIGHSLSRCSDSLMFNQRLPREQGARFFIFVSTTEAQSGMIYGWGLTAASGGKLTLAARPFNDGSIVFCRVGFGRSALTNTSLSLKVGRAFHHLCRKRVRVLNAGNRTHKNHPTSASAGRPLPKLPGRRHRHPDARAFQWRGNPFAVGMCS